MEWVETTGKSVDEARERALEELGVADDDAEIEVLEEPKAGLFGLMRSEARVRARVRPTEVRPKVDRRRGRKKDGRGRGDGDEQGAEAGAADAVSEVPAAAGRGANGDDAGSDSVSGGRGGRGGARGGRGRSGDSGGSGGRPDRGASDRSGNGDGADDAREHVAPEAVGAAAVQFMEGLVEALDLDGTVELEIDGTELDVRVAGAELGLLIGPGGRTLLAVQDLARVAAQRRLGDHETRLRIDVAGYRERRREALERFARSVAEQVIESGRARSLEPMPSADRKVVHDVLVGIDGVSSHSEGDDPDRRVVVTPA